MRGLNKKRVIVAGGGAGIGAATAVRLGEEGARVAVGDVDLDSAEATARRITAAGGEAVAVRFDLNEPQSLKMLVSRTVEVFGGLDAVANIAADTRLASSGNDVCVADMDPAIWDATIRANLTGYALIIQAALPHLISAGGGSIVNTTSDATKAAEKERPAYAASKAGINTLTRHVASTWGKQGVRCNAVSPGVVMSETAKRALDANFQNMVLSTLPLTRLGEPEDLAGVIAFLLSDDAQWVTGQVWAVNGGGGFRD